MTTLHLRIQIGQPMQDIFVDAIELMPSLAQEYGEIMLDISGMAKELRATLLDEGNILPVPSLSEHQLQQKSMCAIDGASGSEKMQSADILVAGSTLHEGAKSASLFTDEDGEEQKFPYSRYVDVRLHAAKNDQILSAMRAYGEIQVLGDSTHDISIIDGAYLGNLLTVLYQLQDSPYTAQRIVQSLKSDTDGRFIRGVRKILDVAAQNASGKNVIALAKSDSSRELVKRYIKSPGFFATDKMLAEYLLKPGEMLRPAPVRSNIDRVSMLEKDGNTWAGFKWDPESLETDEYRAVTELMDGTGQEESLFALYTYLYQFEAYQYFYFKPAKFNEGSNPLRVEFVADVRAREGFTDRLVSKAAEIAGHVSADIVNPSVKEPYAQYMVDRTVKRQVTSVLRYYRANIAQHLKGTGVHVDGLISGYRT